MKLERWGDKLLVTGWVYPFVPDDSGANRKTKKIRFLCSAVLRNKFVENSLKMKNVQDMHDEINCFSCAKKNSESGHNMWPTASRALFSKSKKKYLKKVSQCSYMVIFWNRNSVPSYKYPKHGPTTPPPLLRGRGMGFDGGGLHTWQKMNVCSKKKSRKRGVIQRPKPGEDIGTLTRLDFFWQICNQHKRFSN